MRTQLFLWLLLLAVARPMASLAHDPLREDDEHHHQHELPGGRLVSERPDLAAVRTLVESFRVTGDDGHLDDAWDLLRPALDRPANDPEVLTAAAFVAQSRHDFQYAEQLIGQAQAISPNNDEGWLLLASIRLVRGESQSAAEACGRLQAVPLLIMLTCKARAELAGDNRDRALAQLQRLLDVTALDELPPDLLAWSYSVLGDLAVQAGQMHRALDSYRRSLALAERTQVRAAYVDALMELRLLDAAWQALNDGAPALPLLVRRLIVAKELGRLREWQSVLTRVEREFETWIDESDWLHAREMTRFFIDVVDRPELARRLALINLQLQREPEDRHLEQRTRQRESA